MRQWVSSGAIRKLELFSRGNPARSVTLSRMTSARIAEPQVSSPFVNAPGMTETVLDAFLQTMPNIRLEPEEMRDFVSYILSLKRP